MAGYQADTFDSAGHVRPYLVDGEHAGGQLYRPAHLLAGLLPVLVAAKCHAQLLGGAFLCPSHADTPQAQFKALHNSPRYVQILRNDLGETLSHYARFAHGVMRGGGFGD